MARSYLSFWRNWVGGCCDALSREFPVGGPTPWHGLHWRRGWGKIEWQTQGWGTWEFCFLRSTRQHVGWKACGCMSNGILSTKYFVEVFIPITHSTWTNTRNKVSSVRFWRSTRPCVRGRTAVEVIFVIREAFMNSFETSAVRLGALSDCIRVGVQWWANHFWSSKREVVIASYSSWLHGTASANLEKWSIMTRTPVLPSSMGQNFMWSYWTSSLKYHSVCFRDENERLQACRELADKCSTGWRIRQQSDELLARCGVLVCMPQPC